MSVATSIFLCMFFVGSSYAILNGNLANPGDFPSVVSIRLLGHYNQAGVILDKNHVLTTAALKDYNPRHIQIQYGSVIRTSDNENVIGVKSIHTNDKFTDENGLDHNIAILELATPIPFSQTVKAAELAKQNELPPFGQTVTTVGWGENCCRKSYKKIVNPKYELCSEVPEGGKGACEGDEGGPLFANGKVIGLTSWVSKPRALKGHPGVYTRVASYSNWINKHIAQ